MIFCPGYAGVQGNKRADMLASQAPLTEKSTTSETKIVKKMYENMLNDDTSTPVSVEARMT